MTNKEKKLTAYLLELASDTFCNNGCNDLDRKDLNLINFSKAEKTKLFRDYHTYNGDWEEMKDEDPIEGFDYMPDFAWMSFFAHKLMED